MLSQLGRIVVPSFGRLGFFTEDRTRVKLEMLESRVPNFWVGNIPIYGDLILSPMDGISDSPFRSFTHNLGSSMCYTEFISAIDVNHPTPSLPERISFNPVDRPVVFQVFDDNPERLIKAVLRLQQYSPDIIDINMGCSDKSVAARGAGAGLLRTPSKIAEIFSKLSTALKIPITGKIRLGWDESSQNYMLISRIIEENGGKLVAVHGRTKVQSYHGIANWEAIAEIKQALSIPVIGNGDVRTVADIERIKNVTKCDGVMIGRAAIENPWIFQRKDREEVTLQEVIDSIHLHLSLNLTFYGPKRGLMLFRKFAKKYLTPYHPDREHMLLLMTAEDLDGFYSHLQTILKSLDYSLPLS
jgi:tRNA-dihydrouridine synthase B